MLSELAGSSRLAVPCSVNKNMDTHFPVSHPSQATLAPAVRPVTPTTHIPVSPHVHPTEAADGGEQVVLQALPHAGQRRHHRDAEGAMIDVGCVQLLDFGMCVQSVENLGVCNVWWWLDGTKGPVYPYTRMQASIYPSIHVHFCLGKPLHINMYI